MVFKHSRFLSSRHLHFARQQGLKDNQCMVFVHHKPGQPENSRANLCKCHKLSIVKQSGQYSKSYKYLRKTYRLLFMSDAP